MKPARRCTAFGSARSPIRISGCSFSPVAVELLLRLGRPWRRPPARATDSLSATTMMPLLMSDGGRLKVAIGTSDSCASATTTRPESPSSAVRMMPSRALGDAVLDLLELAVGVLPAVQLDDLDAGVLQRLHDGAVPGHPEAGGEVLEGVADGAALLGRRRRARPDPKRDRDERAARRTHVNAHRSPRSGDQPPLSFGPRSSRRCEPSRLVHARKAVGSTHGKAFPTQLAHGFGHVATAFSTARRR